ncbi:zinc finger SWIM domain-containing protein 7-like isoform X1 [Mizuhopecten yessoensis]|uniref:zinc finger SWIM domain-containing protein 7-like isoform X1 n=1 Tax=Mizuhopecten yessoensis TaxID=6573 RepID=UPI000B45BC1E|nr:zinc finger SWIM domain-containing protein 7-like isoform X1 [Mizuhopecten yessoensis]
MNDLTGSVLYSVTEQLLKEVEHSYKSTGRLTDEILSALQFVFQTTLLPALDLVDQRNVTRLSSPSGRIIYQVVGSSGTPYTCLATSIYCSCPAYRFSVLLKQDHIMRRGCGGQVVKVSDILLLLAFHCCVAGSRPIWAVGRYWPSVGVFSPRTPAFLHHQNQCKHTLAIRLAITMDLCKELKVSNQELVKAITSID